MIEMKHLPQSSPSRRERRNGGFLTTRRLMIELEPSPQSSLSMRERRNGRGCALKINF